MTATVLIALLGLLDSLLVAALTYWLTKRREREAEWRKEKLAYYRAFVESMSGIIEGDDGVHPADDPDTFKPLLWTSGARMSAT